LAVQGHPKSLILVPIESVYVTFCSYYLSNNSRTISELLQVFVLTTPPLFHLNFGGVPVAPDHPCCGQSEQVL